MFQPVYPLDLTLVLPMQVTSAGDPEALLVAESWSRIDPLARGAPEVELGYVYAELAYFHPHVREFLYGKASPNPSGDSCGTVRAYRYAKLHPGHLLIEQDTWNTQLNVRDVYLHHVKPDALLLSVHLSATEPVPWPHALNIVSVARNISYQHYTQHLRKNETGAEHLVWEGADAAILDRLRLIAGHQHKPVIDRGDEMRAAIHAREPKPLALWDQLLGPLRAAGLDLSLLGDHRMATMVFVGVPAPEQITDDEWFALAQADSANYTQYAPAFRQEELRKAAYDRWWDKCAGPEKLKHRYLAGPMTFLSVTRWPQEPRPDYFERMRITWRRQHFQIFLLAHYQRAALLILEKRIASLAARIDPSATVPVERAILGEIERLQGEIAQFSSGHWFPEISPQIQGQELYQLLRKHVCLDALGATVITDPLKKLICSLLGNLAFWGSVPPDWQSLIAGILVLLLIWVIIWRVWRMFRPSGHY